MLRVDTCLSTLRLASISSSSCSCKLFLSSSACRSFVESCSFWRVSSASSSCCDKLIFSKEESQKMLIALWAFSHFYFDLPVCPEVERLCCWHLCSVWCSCFRLHSVGWWRSLVQSVFRQSRVLWDVFKDNYIFAQFWGNCWALFTVILEQRSPSSAFCFSLSAKRDCRSATWPSNFFLLCSPSCLAWTRERTSTVNSDVSFSRACLAFSRFDFTWAEEHTGSVTKSLNKNVMTP